MAKQPSRSPKQKRGVPAPASGGDLGILRELLALLDGSSATSIKLQRGDASYEVSRGFPVMAPPPMPAAHQATQAAPAAPATPAAPSAPLAAPSNLIEIKSPMVGTFYRAPEPGAEPYVKAGSRVAPGQTLCIIEAMKIMNEIESEVGGTVREIIAEDAQPVEFGQVLFRVEPHV